MAQYKVYRNRRSSRGEIPFLLDVQSNLVTTSSRIVVPLVRRSGYEMLYSRLNLELTVDGAAVVASFSDLAALDERELNEVVADLSDRRDEILAAVDFLFTGH